MHDTARRSYHILNSDSSACVSFYDYGDDYCKLSLVTHNIMRFLQQVATHVKCQFRSHQARICGFTELNLRQLIRTNDFIYIFLSFAVAEILAEILVRLDEGEQVNRINKDKSVGFVIAFILIAACVKRNEMCPEGR